MKHPERVSAPRRKPPNIFQGAPSDAPMRTFPDRWARWLVTAVNGQPAMLRTMGSRCTQGRRLLLAALQTLSYSALAARLAERAKTLRLRKGQAGWSKASISYWGSGAKNPGYGSRKLLHAELLIPMDAWDEDAANDTVAQAA